MILSNVAIHQAIDESAVDVLRRLGWSEELIAAAVEATQPSVTPGSVVDVLSSDLKLPEMPDTGIGTTGLDLSKAPIVGSSTLSPPRMAS
jgi:hypothetical protein